MVIKVERKYKKASYTIGKLYVDGVAFCDTLEDKDRGLRQGMSLTDLQRLKLNGQTAIPTGEYSVTMRVQSLKFGGQQFYRDLCGGRLPRLLNVSAFEGVLIHCGNSAADTQGCILVGRNRVVGGLTDSRETFTALYKAMKAAADKGEDIKLTIA